MHISKKNCNFALAKLNNMYPQQIIDALRHVRYPGTGKDLIESGMLEDDIRISGFEVSFSLIFQKENDPFIKSVLKAAETALKTYIDPNIAANIHTKFVKVNPTPTTNHQSPIAANRVGLLDADIHGPSMPKMFHTEDCRPFSVEIEGRTLIEPIEQFGVKMLSIGFFVNPDQAVIWRGGMASNAIKQLIDDAHWGELDYFLIDLPPGTSDIHLTLISALQLTGVIVVTTPQPVALVDARKGVEMFQNEKINVPILGLVENMAWFTPAELPQNRYYIFGKDGGKALAEELQIPLLAQIPLVQSIREGGDSGEPIALQTGHPAASAFDEIATKII